MRRRFLVAALALAGASSPPSWAHDGGVPAIAETETRQAPRKPDATPAPPAPRKRRTEHVVAGGDTLGAIARRHGVTVVALATANGLSREATIRVGQRLIVPAKGEIPRAPARVHAVVQGNTLGGIARQYGVSVDQLLDANHLRKSDPLRIGQELAIPGEGRAAPAAGVEPSRPPRGEMLEVDVRGSSAPAYYYEPDGPGGAGMRPVIVYLHGRGASPAAHCRRWSRVARNLGWLVCPSGPEDRGDGTRGWNNDWTAGRTVVLGAVDALRKKYGRRVQAFGNTLIGFSEGAYVAMNVGLREPKTFNRWLILGADGDYWGASGLGALPDARGRVRRVYLITGESDDVAPDTAEVRRWLLRAGVPVRVSTPKDMGHEVALETRAPMYEAALQWLAQG